MEHPIDGIYTTADLPDWQETQHAALKGEPLTPLQCIVAKLTPDGLDCLVQVMNRCRLLGMEHIENMLRTE